MGRIILTGDIHGDPMRLYPLSGKGLTKDDIVIVLGDFGLIWNDKERTKKVLELLGELNFTLAFVDGNHENFDLIEQMEETIFWNDGVAGLLPGGVIHLYRGQIYKINNKVIGVCGGANSVDKDWREPKISWWEQEEITHKDVETFRINLNDKYSEEKQKIDLMLSHDCPASLVPLVALYSGVNGAAISNSQRQLEKILNLVEIDKWYFGHWHINKKISDKFECLYTDFKEV